MLKSAAEGSGVGHYLPAAFLVSGNLLPATCYLLSVTCYRLMPSADRNDLMPAPQEKLEWVTPKISLMEAEDTEGTNKVRIFAFEQAQAYGPS